MEKIYKYKGREKEYKKEWRKKHRKYLCQQKHQYYLEHKEQHDAYSREYNKKLYRQRRAEYMANKSCLYCGTTENLCLHHSNPSSKDPALEGNNSSNIWIWSQKKRNKELAKCVIVCKSCHATIHNKLNRR